MRLVLPFGFYCAGNTGDEATLNGFARLLSAHGFNPASTWTGCRRPELMPRAEPAFNYFSTQRRDPWRWWAKLLGSAYSVVGGTPIQEASGEWPMSELKGLLRSIERRKAPVAFVGVGVENLHCGGKRSLFSNEFAPRVHHWSPRSNRGRERLIEYGVPESRITLAADLAWLIEPATPDFGQKRLQALGIDPQSKVIGVNLAHELFDEHPHLAETLARELDTLVTDTDSRIIFFVHDVSEVADRDLAAAQKIMARLQHPDRALAVPNEYYTPRQMMSLIGCCQQTISMHYHFSIYSALQGVPFLTLHQIDKVLDLCADMDWTDSVFQPDFAPESLIRESRRLHSAAASTNQRLSASVNRMKQLANENIVSLHALKRK